MNNITSLFENLMTYNEVNVKKKTDVHKNVIKEGDSTLLNLSLEIPSDKDEITPEDIDVNVGVMNLENDEDTDINNDTEDNDSNDADVDEISIDDDDEMNFSNSESDKEDDDDKKDKEDKKDNDKEESLKRKRLEAYKRYKESKNIKKEAADVDKAKKNILNRVKNKTEGKDIKCTGKKDCECEACKSKKQSVKESILRLDTSSLNKLINAFVKENYKNIDKIVINKAMLESNMLTLTGSIKDLSGKTESIKLINRGFNVAKCENKRFIIDFKDGSNTFNVIKENLKQPFAFTASLKNGVLKFESLKYNFKTKITEGKVANVYGTCNVLKESKTHKYNRSKTLKEAINQTEITVSCAPFDDEADKQEYADYVKDKYNLKLVDYTDGGDDNSSLTLFGTFDDIKKYFTDVQWDDWELDWEEYGDDVKQQYLKSINSTDEEDWYNYLHESKTHKYIDQKMLKEATLKPMSGTDLLNYQGANNFADGTKPFIAEGKGGTFLIAGSDEKDGKALITIYYGPDGDQWAWKSYSDKETALEDGRLLVNLIDEEINVMQLKRFGFELM